MRHTPLCLSYQTASATRIVLHTLVSGRLSLLVYPHLGDGLVHVAPGDGGGGAAAGTQPGAASCEVFLTEFKDAALPVPTIITDSFQEGQQQHPEASLSASFNVRCAHAGLHDALTRMLHLTHLYGAQGG